MSINKLVKTVPVPGANYAADTRHFPWHKPPEMTDYDEIIDYLIKEASTTDKEDRIVALLEYGVDVTSIVSMIFMSAIGQGRFSIDMALLVAGPFGRYLEILGKNAGIKNILLGYEDDSPPATVEDLRLMGGMIEDGEDVTIEESPVEEPEPEQSMESTGLMGMPADTEMNDVASQQEQEAMLGNEEEVV